MHLSSIVLALILGFIVTLLTINILRPVAIKIGLVDNPGGRKAHIHPTPLVGGVAIFIGFFFGILCLPLPMNLYRGLFLASFLITFFGVLDDMHELKAKYKLLVQIVVGFIVALLGKNSIHTLGDLLSHNYFSVYMGIPFTVFCVCAMVNASNMLDGEDGFAGSINLIQLLSLAFLADKSDMQNSLAIILLLVSTLLAFLTFNFPFTTRNNARIFMGDAGSMLTGCILAWFAIEISQQEYIGHPVAIIWFIALPIFDMIRLFANRLFQKQSPFKPDRNHLHHLLKSKLGDKRKVIAIAALLTIVFDCVGYAFIQLNFHSDYIITSYIICLLAYCYLVNKLEKRTNQVIKYLS